MGVAAFALLPASALAKKTESQQLADSVPGIPGLPTGVPPAATASFTFTWYPDLDSSSLRIGPTGDYWVGGLQARTSTPGGLATVSASSAAISEPEETVEHHTGTADGPTPAVTDSLTWTPGASAPTRQSLQLTLTDVAAASVEAARAGLTCGTVTVSTDGATALTLTQLRPRSAVTDNGTKVQKAPKNGTATVNLAAGTSTLGVCAKLPR